MYCTVLYPTLSLLLHYITLPKETSHKVVYIMHIARNYPKKDNNEIPFLLSGPISNNMHILIYSKYSCTPNQQLPHNKVPDSCKPPPFAGGPAARVPVNAFTKTTIITHNHNQKKTCHSLTTPAPHLQTPGFTGEGNKNVGNP